MTKLKELCNKYEYMTYTINWCNATAEALINTINAFAASCKCSTSEINIDIWSEEDAINMEFVYKKPKTHEEIEKEIKQAQLAEESAELKEYKRLHKKYGKKARLRK